MPVYEDLNKAALQAIGLTPQWELLNAAGYTGYPSAAGDGLYLEATPSLLVIIRPRGIDTAVRTCDVTMDTLDAGATYTVSVNGTGMNYATPSDEDDLLTGLRDAIKADATVGQAAATPIVDATALDSDGADVSTSANPAVTLRVFGDAAQNADYYIDISATGSGVLACAAEPISCTARMWGMPGGTAKSGTGNDPTTTAWTYIADAEYAVDSKGYAVRYDCAGFDRWYVELDSIAKHASDGASVTLKDVLVHLGPAVISE